MLRHEFFRSTRNLMAPRVWAFALIVVTVTAPVAASVCQVACGAHAMGAKDGHAHHHSSASTSTLGAAPHTCDHQSRLTVGIQQVLQVLTGPALVSVQEFALPQAEVATAAPRALDRGHSPPGALALTTQLRV